jgi:hypothetical protein
MIINRILIGFVNGKQFLQRIFLLFENIGLKLKIKKPEVLNALVLIAFYLGKHLMVQLKLLLLFIQTIPVIKLNMNYMI